jgi:cyclase
MNRRYFLKTTSFTALMTMFSPYMLRGADSAPAFDFSPIRRGVGYFKMSGGTMGWMIDPECFAVVDTQFPENATKFMELTKPKAMRALDILFNTHHHHDHTGGNPVIAPLAKKTVAHRNCVTWQKKASQDPEAEVYATTLIDTSLSIEVPGEIITSTYYGNAHTSGDIVIHFENADVVHVGDIVFNRCPPYIDQKAGASVAAWIEVLETLHSQYSGNTKFIFGHGLDPWGVTGNRSDLLSMRDFLSELLNVAGKSIANGESKETLMQTMKVPGFEEYYLDSWANAIPDALAVAYDELNTK